YYYDHADRENQCTAVTETHGALKGKRVVRGRERECRQYYTRVADDGGSATSRAGGFAKSR
ncbi:MAG: hypothetical protein OEN20_08940, partial [Gammaproteobacteria bacterium]|nr:hypothetical protein [Gammaproteobacteria bacterium]